jgi:hypothetical protein
MARATLGKGSSEAVAELRVRLEERFGGTCILTDSGTHALQLAIEVAVTRRPGPVLIPAYTCYDVATAVIGAGAEALVYDVDPDSLTPDLDSVRAGLRRGAAALILGPLYGYAFATGEFSAAVHEAGGVLIHDAAQGHGALIDDREPGSCGDLSVLSFGRGKGWTGGGGGALMLRHPELVSRVPPPGTAPPGSAGVALRTAAQYVLARPTLYGIPASLPWLGLGETHYQEPSPPGGMSPWSARLILDSERAAAREGAARRARGLRMLEALRRTAGTSSPVRPIVPPSPEGCGFLRLPVLRSGGLAALPSEARQLGISGGYPRALPDLPPLAPKLLNAADPMPGARELASELVTPPTHGLLQTEEERNVLEMARG